MNISIHPITIGTHKVSSNVFFAPINPGLARDGEIGERYIDFFVQHSGKNIGVCYIGNVAINSMSKSNINTAIICSHQASIWSELTSKIRARDSIPAIQLAWKPKSMIMQKDFIQKDLETQLMLFREFYDNFYFQKNIIDDFREKIKLSKKCGFSIVQIHAAHGYGLSLLLSPATNTCIPAKSKGMSIIKQLIECVKDEGMLADIRLSLYEGILPRDSEFSYKLELVSELQKTGIDIVSLSNGIYNVDKNYIYPPKCDKKTILSESIEIASNNKDMIINTAGNMEFAIMSSTEYPPNLTFSLGRQLLADVKTVEKIINKDFQSIKYCSECNECHYYSNSTPYLRICR